MDADTPSSRPGSRSRRAYVGLFLSLARVVGGGWLAHSVQTDSGRVEVRDREITYH